MRLTEVRYDTGQPVESYGPGFFRVGGAVHDGPLLILPVTGLTPCRSSCCRRASFHRLRSPSGVANRSPSRTAITAIPWRPRSPLTITASPVLTIPKGKARPSAS